MVTFQQKMEFLCLRIQRLAKDKLSHERIYDHIAKAYNLYDENGMKPIWLSRVIEGILRDVQNGEDDRF